MGFLQDDNQIVEKGVHLVDYNWLMVLHGIAGNSDWERNWLKHVVVVGNVNLSENKYEYMRLFV
jgi:hypothetical protein